MPSRPNVKKLARRNRFEGLAAAAQYHDWAQLRDGSYVDLGITVRRDAVAALADVEDPRAVGILSRALSDPAPPVRAGAVTSLERRLDPAVASVLATAYLRFEAADDDVPRSAALAALQSHPLLTAGPVVRTVIEATGKRELEESEVRLLRTMAGGGSEARERTTAALVDALAHDTAATGERAVEGLVALGSDSVPALLEAMDDPIRRARAAVALGRCGDGRAVEALIRLLDDQRPEVRRAAADTLGDVGDPRAVAPLIAAAQDEHHETRVAAASALDRLGSAGLIVSISRQSGGETSPGLQGRPAGSQPVWTPEPRAGDGRPADATGVDGDVLEQRLPARQHRPGVPDRRGARQRRRAIGRWRELGATLATAALARASASRQSRGNGLPSAAREDDHVPDAARSPAPAPAISAQGATDADATAAMRAPSLPVPADAGPPPTPRAPEMRSTPQNVSTRPVERPLEPEGVGARAQSAVADPAETSSSPGVTSDQDRGDRRRTVPARAWLVAGLSLPIIGFGAAFAVGRETGTRSSSEDAQGDRSAGLIATTPVAPIEPPPPPKRPRQHAQSHHPARKPAAAPAVSGGRYVPSRIRPVVSPRRVVTPRAGVPSGSGTGGGNGNHGERSTSTNRAPTAPGTGTNTSGGGTTTQDGSAPPGTPTLTITSPSGGSPSSGGSRTSTNGGAESGTVTGSR